MVTDKAVSCVLDDSLEGKERGRKHCYIGLLRVKCVHSSLHYRVPISAASDLLWEALCLNLMNHTIDAIVQQLLVVVVQGGVHLIISQPGILPDLLQGVVLH